MVKEKLCPDQLLKPNNMSKEIEIIEGNVNHLENRLSKNERGLPS